MALTIALARRPEFLVLDEPLAALDPLARHEFLAAVMEAVAEDGISVLFSSHALTELERVADYLVVLADGRVQVAGEVGDLLASHRTLTGPAREVGQLGPAFEVVHGQGGQSQAHVLARFRPPATVPGGWQAHPVTLEELVLGYLREPGASALPGPETLGAGTVTGVACRDRASRSGRGTAGPEAATAQAGRLGWLTWRQHRGTLIGLAVFIALIAGYMLVSGLRMHHLWDELVRAAACTRPPGRPVPAAAKPVRRRLAAQLRRRTEPAPAAARDRHRGVPRGTAAGPGVRVRHDQVRVDPEHQPDPADGGQARATRAGRAGRGRRARLAEPVVDAADQRAVGR